MSLDYYIQGFCLSSLTLRPSAFYAAASLRTAAVRPAIWMAVRANMSAGATGSTPACVAEGTRRGEHPGLNACQMELCSISGCNL